MKPNITCRRDVWLFTLTVSAVLLLVSLALRWLLLPPGLFRQTAVAGSCLVLILGLPLAFVAGDRLRSGLRLTRRLRHAATHDALTGLCTRSGFRQRARGLIRPPSVVAVADIDRFKDFNDRYGHQAGDRALAHVAQVLRRNCRSRDLLARFGGEEFVILLRGVTGPQARAIAERFCARLRAAPLPLDGGARVVTVSFGLSDVQDAADLDAAIHRADLALYRAKAEGRDRARLHATANDPAATQPGPPAPVQPATARD